MILKTYNIQLDDTKVQVRIVSDEDFVSLYKVASPEMSKASIALMDSIREDLLKESKIGMEEIFDSSAIKRIKGDFKKKAELIINKKIPGIDERTKGVLISSLIYEMVGLGELEMLLADPDLEEIAINSSKEPVWVYHKNFGWLKTNITMKDERQIQNYSSIIARRVGRQITTLEPLLDAHLITGDRANATLFPISSRGNTITIRRFRRDPWTAVDFIKNKTIDSILS